MLVVAKTDLRQLWQSPDFWVPMLVLGAIFFVVIPGILLTVLHGAGDIEVVRKAAQTLQILPQAAQDSVKGDTEAAKVQYALAVYLFAPLAVVVPLTISTAVGANTIVGERERGTGEFLAHSPAAESEIYIGKLLASLLPGYVTTVIGFGIYSLLVNVIVGPDVGGWFFPTSDWWVLMLWVVPPFLALALSVVLRLSARVRSSAAAQQASGLVTLPLILLSYGQSSGALLGVTGSGWLVGALVWVAAGAGLVRGVRAVSRARLLGIGVD